MLPDSVEPDWVIGLETTTTMLTGMVAGGFELLPGFDVQVCRSRRFREAEVRGALSM